MHEEDLTGFLIDRETRINYNHVCIPATNESEKNIKPPLLKKYYDKETGLFWTDRFNKKVLDDTKVL